MIASFRFFVVGANSRTWNLIIQITTEHARSPAYEAEPNSIVLSLDSTVVTQTCRQASCAVDRRGWRRYQRLQVLGLPCLRRAALATAGCRGSDTCAVVHVDLLHSGRSTCPAVSLLDRRTVLRTDLSFVETNRVAGSHSVDTVDGSLASVPHRSTPACQSAPALLIRPSARLGASR